MEVVLIYYQLLSSYFSSVYSLEKSHVLSFSYPAQKSQLYIYSKVFAGGCQRGVGGKGMGKREEED